MNSEDVNSDNCVSTANKVQIFVGPLRTCLGKAALLIKQAQNAVGRLLDQLEAERVVGELDVPPLDAFPLVLRLRVSTWHRHAVHVTMFNLKDDCEDE